MTSNESFIVDHQVDSCRFIIPNSQAVLEYQLDSKQNRVDFSRTFVPQDLRGSGAAQALVSAGLRWARDEELSIEASCWYVEKFLRRKKP
ncbi:GNAT family N-acetyltransferase [Pseudoteredinibacter isoporae]|uniref:N-acetyltransferase domain-containing protein n=1 Tax=Pseudoteredinibacter isoporae TaxID=570281 RepID=A0A7X0MY67_9GAMM|nr:GNAT family N-acetyltransferase [Pseudoteredinibacter isoporae]MBB6522754.1 hypothetical protein [Pseudoteredinibacter isoporae]NHO88283.1 N-acetyltransferase [Pseudoteredinibacter isoporae]NIB23386.1 N-acetyltransferase [Pseudoteredinibacter isoporae]